MFRFFIFAFISLFYLLNSYSSLAQEDNVLMYRVYDVKSKKEIEISQIVQTLSPGQILVFGEQHDDSIAHYLQLKIYELLHQRFGNQVIMTMEMFHTDIQHVMDEYLSDFISEKNFRTESRAWNNYEDYKPLIEYAKANQLKVIAGNTPSRYVNMVTRKGIKALDVLDKKTKKKYLPPLPIDTLTGIYYEKFLEAMGGHVMPGMSIYHSQNLWDASMAYSIQEASKKNKKALIYQLNGRFHSDYYSGLVHRLVRDYKKKVTTISSFYLDNIQQINWSDFADLADYVIITQKMKK